MIPTAELHSHQQRGTELFNAALDDVDSCNRNLIRIMIQAQRDGRSVLPVYMGLSEASFNVLLGSYFRDELDTLQVDESCIGYEKGILRQQLMELRRDECRDVEELLLAHRNGDSELELSVAAIVSAGCLGGDHLWRDLGLPSRPELRVLLSNNFRSLVVKNSGDMKWKKFFYKQLCEQEGGYVCRSPSCEQCVAYQDCFGPED